MRRKGCYDSVSKAHKDEINMKYKQFMKSKEHLKCSSCEEYGRNTPIWSLKDKEMYEQNPEDYDYINRKLCDPCWNSSEYYGQGGI